MQDRNFTLSAVIGFLWTISVAIIAAIVISRGLPLSECRESILHTPFNAWQWWYWNDGIWVASFLVLAVLALVTMLGCAQRGTISGTIKAAMWLSVMVGSLIWLFSSSLLFWMARCFGLTIPP